MLREFVERGIRRETIRKSIIVWGVALAAIFALWTVDSLAGLAHPLKMFANNVHGGLSAFAVQLSGGTINSFTLSPAGGYNIEYQGGSEILLYTAGYLGSALLGALMFFLTNRAQSANLQRLVRAMNILTGIFTVIFTALFIQPQAASDITAWALCLGLGIALIILGLWGMRSKETELRHQFVNQFVMNVLALMVALHIVFDLGRILSTPAVIEIEGVRVITNPVAAFAENITPGISTGIIAVCWSVIAIALMSISFHLSIIKPLRAIPKNDDIFA